MSSQNWLNPLMQIWMPFFLCLVCAMCFARDCIVGYVYDIKIMGTAVNMVNVEATDHSHANTNELDSTTQRSTVHQVICCFRVKKCDHDCR